VQRKEAEGGTADREETEAGTKEGKEIDRGANVPETTAGGGSVH